jgi:hypothetical protein
MDQLPLHVALSRKPGIPRPAWSIGNVRVKSSAAIPEEDVSA